MKLFKNVVSGVINVAAVAGICAVAYAAHAQSVEDQIVADFETQLECVAKNVYFEARSESELGMRAVAWVTLNRVQHNVYPDTACGVVTQARTDSDGNPIRNQCQFSWYCDGKSDRVANQELWVTANIIAEDVMRNYGLYPDPTGGSIMYHATYVRPYWKDSYEKVVQIDTHVFYK